MIDVAAGVTGRFRPRSEGMVRRVCALASVALSLGVVSACDTEVRVTHDYDESKVGQAQVIASQEVLDEVFKADQAFSDYAQIGGVAAAFAEYMDVTDGVMISPGEVTKGADAIGAAFSDWPADLEMKWSPDMGHASAFGDLAVTSGRYVRTRNGETVGEGRYVTAWRKNAEGEWKAVMDIGNPDPPPAPPPDPEGRPG